MYDQDLEEWRELVALHNVGAITLATIVLWLSLLFPVDVPSVPTVDELVWDFDHPGLELISPGS